MEVLEHRGLDRAQHRLRALQLVLAHVALEVLGVVDDGHRAAADFRGKDFRKDHPGDRSQGQTVNANGHQYHHQNNRTFHVVIITGPQHQVSHSQSGCPQQQEQVHFRNAELKVLAFRRKLPLGR